MDLPYRARSSERKTVLPVTRHQRSSSVGPHVQNVFCTPLSRQNSNVVRSSTRSASTRKYGNVQLPTGDKEFRTIALNKVRQYFQQNADIDINWAIFGSQPLTVATYVELFNFLLRKIFRSVKMNPRNYVDELPNYMKTLGYPLNIQKSSLLTINTKNSWPNVLAMLTFLVDFVSMCDDSAVSELVHIYCSDAKLSEGLSMVWSHNLKSYVTWSTYGDGEDHRKLEEANQQFKEQLSNHFHVDEKIFNAVSKEVQLLKAELEEYKCPEVMEEVQALEDKITDLLKDERKVDSEIQKFCKDLKDNQKKIEEKEHKQHALEEYNKKKKAEIQRLHEKCKTQEMNLEEKHKTQEECLELRERIRISEELCSTLKTSSYQIDQEISKLKSRVENAFKEFKKFQCEIGRGSEMAGINVESRYKAEDWKFAENELKTLEKQLLSKKLALGKSLEELKKKISSNEELQEQLIEEEKSRKNFLKDLDRCMSKLKDELKEIGASLMKEEEEIETGNQKINEEKSLIDNIKAELEDCNKKHDEEALLLQKSVEKIHYIENLYSQIEKDTKEKLKCADLDFSKLSFK